jgi:ATP-dependent RNA helicase SUPV3L1/SUV3
LPVVAAPPVEIASAEALSEAAATLEAVTVEPDGTAAAGEIADIANEAAAPTEVVVEATASRLPGVDFAPMPESAAETPAELPVADAPAESVAATDVVASEPVTAEATDATATDTEPTSDTAVEATVAAEPELVEVWRPGGRPEERRPRHDRSRYKGPDKSAAAPAEGEAAGGETDDKRERHGRHRRRDRHNDNPRPRSDAPPAAAASASNEAPQARAPRDDKGGRPPRERFKGQDRNQDRGKGKFDKGGRDGRKDDRDRGSHRTYATSAPARERDRPADPNSPFAKLAALKEQLAGNRKE